MHIESVALRGYRGLDLEVPLTGPLAVVVGPNNAGKSALIDAIRTVLTPHAGRMGQRWLQLSDFSDDLGPSDELNIVITLGGVPEDERGRLITILAPLAGADKAKIRLRATRTLEGKVIARLYGGDFGQNDVEPMAREALQFVYLPALRDAVGDLRPGPSNKLPSLVSAFAPPGHADRDALIAIAQDANDKLQAVPAIDSSSKAIQDRLNGMTGTSAFAYMSELRFTPSDYDKIVAALQALAGADALAHLQQSGLGYNNLIYVAVVLAALQHENDAALSVLLIEEPEAHLHPQLQSLLMRYLEQLTLLDAQVISTTHSPQFASSAQVERITVLARRRGDKTTAHPLKRAALRDVEFRYLRRFLDVTKSSLLFAEGVILVEGIAEQLLLPTIARRIGVSLVDHGISIVNVEGVAFKPFLGLFTSDALPMRCVAISDSDPYLDAQGNLQPLAARARSLAAFASPQVKISLATRTFEWDLAFANAQDPSVLLRALNEIHPRLAAYLTAEYGVGADPEKFADALLGAVKDSKGTFSQHLTEQIDELSANIVIPSYLTDAITWVIER